MDVAADPSYEGWSPGSTTVSGFGREVTYWKNIGSNARKEPEAEPTWRTATNRPGLDAKFIVQTFMNRQRGLGHGWTERKGYDQVSELVLRKECAIRLSSMKQQHILIPFYRYLGIIG